MHQTHAISWAYRLLLWSADSFHGPKTLIVVRRLFSWSCRLFLWSADSFLIRRLVYSPLTGLSFVDLIIDGQHAFSGLVVVNIVFNGQHQLGLLSSSTSLSPDCQHDFAGLSFANLVASQHPLEFVLLSTSSLNDCQRQLDLLLSTLLSIDSVHWTSFVVNILVNRRPASAGLVFINLVDGQRDFAGLIFVNIVVDGQRPLDLSLSSTSTLTKSQCDFAGLFFVDDLLVFQWPA